MPSEKKEVTLLKTLIDCFSSSKTLIRYVVRKEKGNKVIYELPNENLVEWWKLLYSRAIVSLSIAPKSNNKQLSKDALSSFANKKNNSKNTNILKTNIIPHLSCSKCEDLICEEIEHLAQTIELGVRAKHSPIDRYSKSISPNLLKPASEVEIFIEEAIEFLYQLFMESPYEILSEENPWFVAPITSTKTSEEKNISQEQVLALYASALVLGLNVDDLPDINGNIEKFIKSVFEKSDPKNDKTDNLYKGEVSTSKEEQFLEERDLKRAAALTISLDTGIPQEKLLDAVQKIIDSWKLCSNDVWLTFTKKKKMELIRKDYFELIFEYNDSYTIK